MTIRSKHPNKEIEAAVRDAEAKGWRFQKAGHSAHAWGRLLCPAHQREGCSMSIWSTPRNAFNHAKQIRQKVKKCLHNEE